MKSIKIVVMLFSILLPFFLSADDSQKGLNTQKVVITDEDRVKYPIKPHHKNLAFDCLDCHDGQGNDVSKFKDIGDKGCLSCHKSKKHMAKRLEFMDTLKANPHNSVHDGPTLYCDECHFEHKQSINMCVECHENETPRWMKATP